MNAYMGTNYSTFFTSTSFRDSELPLMYVMQRVDAVCRMARPFETCVNALSLYIFPFECRNMTSSHALDRPNVPAIAKPTRNLAGEGLLLLAGWPIVGSSGCNLSTTFSVIGFFLTSSYFSEKY